MDILFVGIDYFSSRGSGDKNYWFHQLPVLAKHVENIFVVSFNYRKNRKEKQSDNICIYNRRPFHLGYDIGADTAQISNGDKCHSHFQRQPISLIERSLSIGQNIPFLRRLVKERKITTLHFMDNFGPVMGVVAKLLPDVQVCSSAISYMARGRFQDKYLYYSYKDLTKVIPYCETYRKKLVEIGVKEHKTTAIHWGKVFLSKANIANGELERIQSRTELGLEKGTVHILWSGFIQQIDEKSFKLAINIAEAVLTQDTANRVKFTFAFKPESFKLEYQRFSKKGLSIRATEQVEFSQLINASDVFLSPVENTDSIVSPPLTWIECMANGIPVFTNNVPGARDIIKHNRSGFIGMDTAHLVGGILASANSGNYAKMGRIAKSFVEENYNIDNIANQYLSLWEENE